MEEREEAVVGGEGVVGRQRRREGDTNGEPELVGGQCRSP